MSDTNPVATPAPIPTGRLVEGDGGIDLVLTRTLPGTIGDAWASVTAPEKTARWLGRWEGVAAPGAMIRLQMGFEEGTAWQQVKIVECDAPRLIRVRTFAEHGSWDLSIELAPAGDHTDLRFVHHGVVPAEAADIGPGWEYYLDQLLAATTGTPMPNWDDYYPAQKAYFEAQLG